MTSQGESDIETEDAAAIAMGAIVSDISEDTYCAGWMNGIEFALWGVLHGDMEDYAGVTASDPRMVALDVLSRKFDGWVMWDNTVKYRWTAFVPTDKWVALYAAHRKEET